MAQHASRVADESANETVETELAPGRAVEVHRGGSGPFGYALRVAATARNVTEVVRFGGLETDEQASPFVVEAIQRNYRLRHYFADDVPPGATPVVLVPPLMITTEVWDVSPKTSAVASLHAAGIDTWVVDFGRPDREVGGLQRTMTDHVVAVADAVERVGKITGKQVVLGGYSQGGMFCYQAAAYLRGQGIDSLVTFGSPVDTRAPLPIPVSPEVAARVASSLVDSGLLRKVSLPGWAARLGFKALSPAKSVRDRVEFMLALHDRDALLPREKQRKFLDLEGWTAYSGPAIAEFIEQFFAHNRMLEGGFIIEDRLVTLADIEVPILTFVGTTDTIGHPRSVRAIRQAAPRAEVYEVTLRAGHFGLVVGSKATTHSWPAVADWVKWRAGDAALAAEIKPADQVDPSLTPQLNASTATNALTTATEFGVGASRIAIGTAKRAFGIARDLVTEAPAQLPRLARLQNIDPSTRISLGLLLEEQARKVPDDVVILFGDRAVRHREVKHRVDSVVKGLISVGIRQGERVGVLMDTRPSAFTVVAALSRLGATAVLLRPDGDIRREADLGRISWVISDPEHIDEESMIDGVTWCVLGGGAAERELHPRVIDMERIDPDQVVLPAWYRPNPHRASDVAFVIFTGDGASTKSVSVTNRRWALSALGTASAAALKPGDTVYSTTPIYHSSSLLMSVGGAIAGGCRFAMSTSDDPDTFWEEVRRYGVTHVSYTWTSLRAITLAPPNPGEQHHPIKLFMGSGMPRNLWTRVADRFPSARILEFYASTESETILANVGGGKPGSMGRPLPGTAEVRVAAYDMRTRRLKSTSDGFGRETLADEIGLLLTRLGPTESGRGDVLRGVFSEGDSWRSTGDLFLRDIGGDLWLAGSAADIVDTPRGPVLPSGARYCLGLIPAVDLAIAYRVHDGDDDVVVGAFCLLPDTEMQTSELDSAFEMLTPKLRPRYLLMVPEIPLTTWHRPVWRTLQQAGVPVPGPDQRVWRLSDDHVHYEQLS